VSRQNIKLQLVLAYWVVFSRPDPLRLSSVIFQLCKDESRRNFIKNIFAFLIVIAIKKIYVIFACKKIRDNFIDRVKESFFNTI
jgi:ribosome biogenesis protein Nip4